MQETVFSERNKIVQEAWPPTEINVIFYSISRQRFSAVDGCFFLFFHRNKAESVMPQASCQSVCCTCGQPF